MVCFSNYLLFYFSFFCETRIAMRQNKVPKCLKSNIDNLSYNQLNFNKSNLSEK